MNRRRPAEYGEALRFLQNVTMTPRDRGVLPILLRVAVMFPEAAEVLVACPLRTRADRQRAIVAARTAIAIAEDERVA